MTKEEIHAIPRKEARQLLAQIPLGRGFDDRLLLAVEQAMNLEWWRGYHAAPKLSDDETFTLQAAVENLRSAERDDRIIEAAWRIASKLEALAKRAAVTNGDNQ
jgi:hypothetical protein